MWNQLADAADVDAFVAACRGFHDGTLRGIRVVTGGQVGPTTVLATFDDLQGPEAAVEILCERVVELRLRPSKPDCDSILAEGRIAAARDGLVLAVNFIGGPLRGPPGGRIAIPWRSLDDPDVHVVAGAMAWRRAKRADPAAS